MNICLNKFLNLSAVRILVPGKATIIKQEHLTMWIVYIVLHLGKGVRQDIIISSKPEKRVVHCEETNQPDN